MAVKTFVDSFLVASTDIATTTFARSGYGFAPKGCIVWTNGRDNATDAVGGSHLWGSVGYASSTSRRASITFQSQDALGSSDTSTIINNDAVLCAVDTANARDGALDISSFDSDGITFVVDDQFPLLRDTRVFVWAFGGDSITNVEVGTWTTPTATGNHTINNVDNFQPSIVFLGITDTATVNTGEAALKLGFGFGISSTKRGRVALSSANSVTTMNTNKNSTTNECAAHGVTGGITHRTDFVSFNTSPGGMTLNQLEGTTARQGMWLMIKGGDWNGGTVETRTDGNDIVVTGLASQPSGILFFGPMSALSADQDTPDDHNMFSLGAASSTSNRGCMAFTDEDALADSEVATAIEYDEVYISLDLADGIAALMDLKSIESTGFTCVMDDTEPTAASAVHWVSVGPVTDAAGQPTVKRFGGVPYMAINRGVW